MKSVRKYPWHRRWHGAALNARGSMSLEEWGAYTILLDTMYDHRGPIRDDEFMGCSWLRCDKRVWRRLRAALVETHGKLRAFVDAQGVGWLLNDKVQEELKLETSAELAGKVRDKSAGATPELSRKSPKKPNGNNDRPSGEARKSRPKKKEERRENPPPPAGEVSAAFEAWNELAHRCALPVAETLNRDRSRKIAARLEEHGLDGWKRALAAVERSRFCRGMIEGRAFKASLDFVCQPSSFVKLLEGTYGNDARPAVRPSASVVPFDMEEVWRQRVARYRSERYWLRDEWGPPPSNEACRVSPSILEEFGFRLKSEAA